jgi:hypothetical protein
MISGKARVGLYGQEGNSYLPKSEDSRLHLKQKNQEVTAYAYYLAIHG